MKTSEFVRQPNTQALISSDNKGYAAYMQQRERNNKVAELENSVNALKSDISQIKELLLKLVDGK